MLDVAVEVIAGKSALYPMVAAVGPVVAHDVKVDCLAAFAETGNSNMFSTCTRSQKKFVLLPVVDFWVTVFVPTSTVETGLAHGILDVVFSMGCQI